MKMYVVMALKGSGTKWPIAVTDTLPEQKEIETLKKVGKYTSLVIVEVDFVEGSNVFDFIRNFTY